MSHHTLITMSTGVSMETWKTTGLLSREMGYYSQLAKQTGSLTFLTYDVNENKGREIAEKFVPGVQIVRTVASHLTSKRFGDLLSSLLSCFLPKSKFRDVKLIRSNQFYGSWAGLVLAKRLNVPFILRCGYLYSDHYEREHKSRFKNWVVQTLERKVAESASAIIVTYENAKQYFVTKYGIAPEKITVLGNPIDTTLFRPHPEVEKTKDVLTIGRLEEQKNYFALIEACQKADLSLTILGKGSLKSKLETFAKSIHAKVEFLNPIPNEEIPALLVNYKVFALPSFYEGNPKSLLEALSSGIPCIASIIPEHEGIIENGQEGVLCHLDVQSIKEALLHVINNPDLAKSLGTKGREKILSSYSQLRIAEKEAVIHKKLLEGRTSHV